MNPQRSTRRIALRLALLIPLCLANTGHAAVTVTFDHPEKFFDIEDQDGRSEANLAIIEKKLVALGKQYLPADDDVRITITDVDLAGRLPMGGASFNRPRILTGGADWPRITLRYTETRGGATTGPIDESIVDQNYLDFGAYRGADNEPLPYERRMLEKWFKERFVERKAAPVKRGKS